LPQPAHDRRIYLELNHNSTEAKCHEFNFADRRNLPHEALDPKMRKLMRQCAQSMGHESCIQTRNKIVARCYALLRRYYSLLAYCLRFY
jgi:hypothetical protein